MSPRRIVREADRFGLDIIGICDHNSCENVCYVKKSARRLNIGVIGGFEITSSEEVHVLALFDHASELMAMQEIVYDSLPGTNDEKVYGDQVVANEYDEVVDFNKRLLIGATELSIESIVNRVHELNGLAIAAHIDRPSFSLISQLGFVPEGLKIDALEVSAKDKMAFFKDISLPLVTFSDAHSLDNIGKSITCFVMAEANLEEMKKSLVGEDGRKVIT
jgi:PHP family Zn ribbon phosphoesterase